MSLTACTQWWCRQRERCADVGLLQAAQVKLPAWELHALLLEGATSAACLLHSYVGS